jgi:hypothetical protein
MAAALEERSTGELLDRNSAIDTLKKEIEVLAAEKSHLLVEDGSLTTARTDAENLHKEAKSLRK